jgi:hypothetical protein
MGIDDEIERRLASSAARFATIGPRLAAGGPWPLAERFDHAPEASWGPLETLAHLEEMLGYWMGEMDRVVAATAGASPEPFGRLATDAARLAVIEGDRALPIQELVTRVTAGIDAWRRRWPELDEAQRERRGLHPSLGVLTVREIATRFVADHVESHLDQLDASLEGR